MKSFVINYLYLNLETVVEVVTVLFDSLVYEIFAVAVAVAAAAAASA